MNELTIRLMDKILNYLLNREGCTVIATKKELQHVEATVTDVFGFIYSVQIKCVGKLKTDANEVRWTYDTQMAFLDASKKFNSIE